MQLKVSNKIWLILISLFLMFGELSCGPELDPKIVLQKKEEDIPTKTETITLYIKELVNSNNPEVVTLAKDLNKAIENKKLSDEAADNIYAILTHPELKDEEKTERKVIDLMALVGVINLKSQEGGSVLITSLKGANKETAIGIKKVSALLSGESENLQTDAAHAFVSAAKSPIALENYDKVLKKIISLKSDSVERISLIENMNKIAKQNIETQGQAYRMLLASNIEFLGVKGVKDKTVDLWLGVGNKYR